MRHCMCVLVCVCTYINQKSRSSQGGLGKQQPQRVCSCFSLPTHAPEAHKSPTQQQPPPLLNPRPPFAAALPLPALSGGYAHAFASLPVSSRLVSPPPPSSWLVSPRLAYSSLFLAVQLQARTLSHLLCCLTPATPLLSLSPALLLCSTSHLSSFLPLLLQVLLPHLLCLRVPVFSCHLRVISLRLSRVFDFFRNSPFSLHLASSLSISLSLCSLQWKAQRRNVSACSFTLVCFVFALLAAFRFLILKLQLCLSIAHSLLHTQQCSPSPLSPSAHYFAVEQVYQQEQENPLRLAKLFIERVREGKKRRERERGTESKTHFCCSALFFSLFFSFLLLYFLSSCSLWS